MAQMEQMHASVSICGICGSGVDLEGMGLSVADWQEQQL